MFLSVVTVVVGLVKGTYESCDRAWPRNSFHIHHIFYWRFL